MALASAPRILFANNQFRRPTAKFFIARSALLLSILRCPSSLYSLPALVHQVPVSGIHHSGCNGFSGILLSYVHRAVSDTGLHSRWPSSPLSSSKGSGYILRIPVPVLPAAGHLHISRSWSQPLRMGLLYFPWSMAVSFPGVSSLRILNSCIRRWSPLLLQSGAGQTSDVLQSLLQQLYILYRTLDNTVLLHPVYISLFL